ncbi:MAG: NAD-dependent epimerase/dehydratase family protein [Planctomycetaceae bacterium]|nr:MAG: NAD-dependent epimerase/dehydratase family protein [Planctomycetaceae bacterium]
MLVLVTGCGGFLGRHIVSQLLGRGDQVRGLARGEYPELTRQGVDIRRADITDPDAVAAACAGVDAVIHCAAIAGIWGPWQRYHSINTLGTQHVIDACRRHGVPILVHCSSPSVTFDGSDQSGIDESVPYPARHLCHYSHTKALAEQAVLAAHEPGKLHTAALRPHLIWGEADPHLFPRLIDRARRGRLRIVGDGENRIDTVHVENAAAAHLNALDHLKAPAPPGGGRAFFITQDEPVRCWDWIAQVLAIAGVPAPTRRIGLATAWRVGATLEAVYRLAGIRSEPPMTRFLAAQLARDHYFDISAAKHLLGYEPRISTAQGLQGLRQAWAGSGDGDGSKTDPAGGP